VTEVLNAEVDFEDETDEERHARLELESDLDEISQMQVDQIVARMLIVVDEFSGIPLHGYQTPFAKRLIESLIIGDGATLTALFSRQSGKSETVANTVAACMVMLPILAKIFPDLLDKFKRGLWVGCFAPTDEQAEIIYSRIVSRLTSEHAQEFMSDPDIDEQGHQGSRLGDPAESTPGPSSVVRPPTRARTSRAARTT
jgi:hypothetical protein